MLDISGLSKSYNGHAVLADLSFIVGDGETVAIVGRSGCGKTTLLKCIAGLIKPDGGRITFAAFPAGRQQVSLVFQQPYLLPWVNVEGNLKLPARIGKYDSNWQFILSHLALFGVSKYLKYFPHELSIGIAQRICLVRSLAEPHCVLLMDEPLSALDEITRMEIATTLSGLLADRSAMFVTHSIHDAVLLADRVLVIGGSPARILAEISIDLAQPRDSNMWSSERLLPYMQRVLNELEETGE